MAATLAVAVVMLGSLTLTAQTASGFSHTRAGAPGSVSLNAKMSGGHTGTYFSGMGYVWSPMLLNSPTDATRSPASSGDQIVTADYYIYKWSGTAWQYSFTKRTQGSIAAGASGVRMPIFAAYPTNGGYFKVAATFTWWTAGGVRLGQATADWNAAGDYVCNTSVKPCTAGPGWVYIG